MASVEIFEIAGSAHSVTGEAEELRARVRSRASYLKIRRLVELILALLLAPFAIILVLSAAIVIAILMGRPVLIAQNRVGLDGSVFRLFKLRTMRNAIVEDGFLTATNDPRITSFGKFLRRSHLDELPQLWNVLVGDMSLIGPRPEQALLVERYREQLPNYELRHSVRPGLSGYAQVYYGYASTDVETSEKLKYDLFYLQNLSLRLDLQILVRTVAIYLNPIYVR